ncbi:hypothetical protein ACFWN1_26600 [Streptomyces sp. NPDC058459]|uniref:hypothetical protein n=1 Tax=Streptomyces sp. NPDC058459 TaxID=3346508 RepID=UPI0036586506
MTQVDLAAAVRQAARARGLRSGADKQRIRKWELDVTPDPESQAFLAVVFDVPAETVTALGWPNWLPGANDAAPLPLGPHSTVPALREALDNAMDRRAFLTYSGTALAALALDWATTDPAGLTAALDGKPVDADLVTWLEETSAKLTALPTEQRQFTAALLDAHLTTVTDLIDTGRYTTAVGLRLHSLSSSLAQTVGWHRFDQGRHAAAGRFWHSALHSAHAAGDHDMGAGVLSDFAYQATWRGDPHTAVGILQRASPAPVTPQPAPCSTSVSPAPRRPSATPQTVGAPWLPRKTTSTASPTTRCPPGVPGCRKPTSPSTPASACSTSARSPAPTSSSAKDSPYSRQRGARPGRCSSPTKRPVTSSSDNPTSPPRPPANPSPSPPRSAPRAACRW